jgi:hypothetical protein
MDNKKTPLERVLDKAIEEVTKNDKDYTIVITGKKGNQKSSLGMLITKYLCENMPHLNLNWKELKYFGFGKKDTNTMLRTLPKGQFAVVDEAIYVLDSSEWNTRENRDIRKFLVVGRKLNNIIIWIIPRLKNLDKALKDEDTINVLFHVYEPNKIKIYPPSKINKYVKALKVMDIPFIDDFIDTTVRTSFPKLYLHYPEVYDKYRQLSEQAVMDFREGGSNKNNYESWYTFTEVAGRLRVSKATLKKYMSVGFKDTNGVNHKLAYYNNPLNNRIYIKPEELEAFLSVTGVTDKPDKPEVVTVTIGNKENNNLLLEGSNKAESEGFK